MMRRILRKYPKTFAVIGLVLFAGAAFVWFGRYAVTAGEKYDAFSNRSYGYKVEQYYFWKTTRLTIWKGNSLSYEMYAVYEFGSLTVDKVVDELWLKNDAAIYLNLDVKYHDSVVSVHPIRLIFDFHRGEIYTSSGYTLWRLWNPQNKAEDWMTDSEFDGILKRLNG
jgi:hypothetical protein